MADARDWFAGTTDPQNCHNVTLGIGPPGYGAATWVQIARIMPGIPTYGIRAPGRDNRILEAPLTSMADLVTQANDAIDEVFPDARHIRLVGVCASAKTAYALGCAISHRHPGRTIAIALIEPSAAESASQTPWESVAPNELVAILRKKGAAPNKILDNPGADCFTPMLRADLELVESYKFPLERFLDADIHILIPDDISYAIPAVRTRYETITNGKVIIDTAPLEPPIFNHPSAIASFLQKIM